MSTTSCSRDTPSPSSPPLVLTLSLRRLPPPFHSLTCWMTCWTLQKPHRSQFMGEMVLLLLICLLWLLLRLIALFFASRLLLPHIIHFHLLPLLPLHLHLHHLAPSASGDPGSSGCQSNGLFQIATGCPGSPHQLYMLFIARASILCVCMTVQGLKPSYYIW